MNEATKNRSEEQLRVLGVRVNPLLPTIELPSELSPRSAAAVCARAFVLSFIIAIGYKRSGSEMLGRINQSGLSHYLSPNECKLLAQSSYSHDEMIRAVSLAEAVQACAWALGYLPLQPLQSASDELASLFLRAEPQSRIASAQLRPYEELYAQADFHFRLHWAARQSRLDGSAFPLPEIAIEMRRRALDWIIGVPADWDNISIDT